MIKNFIDISDFTKKDLDKIILIAKKMKNYENKFKNIFNGKTLGLIFEKQSNRTRLSFNVGMQKFGGNVVELNSRDIGFGKRETDEDIIRTLSQYLDCLMIRNNNHNQIKYLASLNILPIINGLTDFSHPCQILSDIFTLNEIFGKISKIKICWVGDFNNVLRSLIQIQKLYMFNLSIVVPKQILKKNNLEIRKLNNSNIYFTENLKEGVKKSDCIMTDVWVSMGEKNNNKKLFFKKYQLNSQIMSYANKNSVFMHCLPAHRNEEVTNELIDGPQSIVWQQAKNRIYVQQSIINYILK